MADKVVEAASAAAPELLDPAARQQHQEAAATMAMLALLPGWQGRWRRLEPARAKMVAAVGAALPAGYEQSMAALSHCAFAKLFGALFSPMAAVLPA